MGSKYFRGGDGNLDNGVMRTNTVYRMYDFTPLSASGGEDGTRTLKDLNNIFFNAYLLVFLNFFVAKRRR